MASPSPMTRRRSPSAGSTRLIARHCRGEACLVLNQNGHRIALSLVDGFDDVPDVLSVDLQRKRTVAADHEAVDVVGGERLPVLQPRSAHTVHEQTREVARAEADGSEERESRVEARAGYQVER